MHAWEVSCLGGGVEGYGMSLHNIRTRPRGPAPPARDMVHSRIPAVAPPAVRAVEPRQTTTGDPMPSLTLNVPHSLGQQQAAERLRGFIGQVSRKYQDQIKDVNEEWTGDTLRFGFKTFGVRIDGTLEVREDTVDVQADLPFAAMMFKGRIEQEIRDALTKALGEGA